MLKKLLCATAAADFKVSEARNFRLESSAGGQKELSMAAKEHVSQNRHPIMSEYVIFCYT